jgi:hypothetical protein
MDPIHISLDVFWLCYGLIFLHHDNIYKGSHSWSILVKLLQVHHLQTKREDQNLETFSPIVASFGWKENHKLTLYNQQNKLGKIMSQLCKKLLIPIHSNRQGFYMSYITKISSWIPKVYHNFSTSSTCLVQQTFYKKNCWRSKLHLVP